MPLEVGQPAPDFSLRDQHGRTVRLSAYQGRALVVVFYPWAFSRVCTGELQDLRDAGSLLSSAEVGLVAISCDPVFSLRAFADAEGIEFPLLSDHWPHGAVTRDFGVFDEDSGAATRSTFVVDGGGIVHWAVHHTLAEARDLRSYLEALGTLVTGT